MTLEQATQITDESITTVLNDIYTNPHLNSKQREAQVNIVLENRSAAISELLSMSDEDVSRYGRRKPRNRVRALA